jgi:putative zinc finger protein
MPNETSCSGFEDLAVLYAFGELGEGDRAAVEAHVQACAECSAMLRSEIALHEAIAAREQFCDEMALGDKVGGPESLLAQCRSELAEALDDSAASASAGAESGWRAWLSPGAWSAWWTGTFRHALAFHPGWSTAALLIVGALAGTAGRAWYRETSLPVPGKPMMTVSAAPRLSDQELETMGVDGIRWVPQDGTAPARVEVQVRSARPVVVQGSADDSEVRRVLAYVIAHGEKFDPGVRLDSLDVLRGHTSDPQVRAALCDAALRDGNPAVRLKALEALDGLGADASVQQARLGALAEDGNSGVRIAAVNALLASLGGADAPATSGSLASPALPAALPTTLLDPQALEILRDREQNDPNRYVRMRSAAVLGRLASFQAETGSGRP